jgi:hypothetical protein
MMVRGFGTNIHDDVHDLTPLPRVVKEQLDEADPLSRLGFSAIDFIPDGSDLLRGFSVTKSMFDGPTDLELSAGRVRPSRRVRILAPVMRTDWWGAVLD